ncbi:MAG TPA: S41 family peptidase [Puia sp.]|nr:S41 family peptidase [Puia sp.]
MRRSFVLLPAVIFFFSSFAYGRGSFVYGRSPESDTAKLSCLQKADSLLDEALSFMKKNYYLRDFIQWDDLTKRAKMRLMEAGNCEDAYETIGWCFRQLNEHHSFVMPPAKAASYNYDASSLQPPPPLKDLVGEIKGEWLSDSIAYLTIPWVSTTDSLVCMNIADSLQALIARLDTRKISRWIIDLRKNSGGNCWPMLAGIGPLLGDGVCGYFVASEQKIPISYRNGAAFQGKHVLCRVSREGYRTQCSRNSVIVLTGRKTVSAGEIVALAFKGKEQAWLFGEPTAGFTTANATYSLSDHSMLVLTVCQEADHMGRICQGSIVPDKLIPLPANNPVIGNAVAEDSVRSAAVSWLRTQ